MHSLRNALYLVAIALMAALWLTKPQAKERDPVKREKPPAATCVAPEGWTAKIERTPQGWACVMRNNKTKTVRAFFYSV